MTDLCNGCGSEDLAEIKVGVLKTAHKIDMIAPKVDTMHKIVTGESEPERGHVVRLDRLERAENARTRLGWIVAGTIAALVANAVWDKIIVGGQQAHAATEAEQTSYPTPARIADDSP